MINSSEYKSKVVPSYLIECVVWNAKNSDFGCTTYKEDLRQTIMDLYTNTKSGDTCNEWGEVNEMKYLFRTSQSWTLPQANAFLVAVWNYLGME
jgi:hypothetical protein